MYPRLSIGNAIGKVFAPFGVHAGPSMIQCRLREIMATKGRMDRTRISYDDIRSETGLSKTTLTRLANDRAERVALSVIDRLCDYFDCQPGDLFVHVREPKQA